MKLPALAVVLLALSGCGRVSSLPKLGKIPDFTLTDQSGAPFQGSSLRGHVWIVDFIYTNCPGPCPLMSERMRRIQNQTPASVKLVSFSVDPARDTPVALTAYSRRFAAVPDRWTFLTGDAKTLQMLDRDAFRLGDLDASFNHSTRFVLVDRAGNIRAYYRMGDDDMLGHIVSDAKDLTEHDLTEHDPTKEQI